MSFRKRNVALTSSRTPPNAAASEQNTPRAQETTSNTTIASPSSPPQSSNGSLSLDPSSTSSSVRATTSTSKPSSAAPTPTSRNPLAAPTTPGTRPSPLDGRPTTSTGTPSLDALLSGHAAQPLGSSLLLQESGTTDYAGALLRCYAAEGVVQGHVVHVVGLDARSGWGRGLPGLVRKGEDREGRRGGGGMGDGGHERGKGNEREMKIAWRYGDRFAGAGGGGACAVVRCVYRSGSLGQNKSIRKDICVLTFKSKRVLVCDERTIWLMPVPVFVGQSERTRASLDDARKPFEDDSTYTQQPFCHTFDLAKRLEHPSTSTIHYHPLPATSANPFTAILQSLTRHLSIGTPQTLHRIVIPSLLSPALYPPHTAHPSQLLTFLHALRALLRRHPSNLVAITSLPTSLHPRTTGLTCYPELLSDGVFELLPFPHREDVDDDNDDSKLGTSGAATKDEERPQGLVKVWKLPGYHERGGGGGGGKAVERALGDDLAFMVSRRKFWVGAFHLPPAEAEKREEEEGKGKGKGGKKPGGEGIPDQKDLEF
ncbi:MAG: hypothetical protein M1831_001631 [Alyxoria varia]|nr:MAG: hypothetical protein M1831_001631 [Alyxoria varia]